MRRLLARFAVHASLLLIGVLVVSGPARALVLDWDLTAWPASGDRSETFTVGSGQVTVNVSDPNNVIATGGIGPDSLATNQYTTPGTDPARPSSLFIKTDGNTAAPWVEVDILFSHTGGVTDVEFSLYDVDLLPLISIFGFPIAGYTDFIRITGVDLLGGSVAPTSISALTATPTWDTVGLDAVVGLASNSEESDDGTALIRFDTPIQSLSLQYRNDLTQGQLQWIGLSSIVFRRAPEPSTALLLGLGLALLARRARSA